MLLSGLQGIDEPAHPARVVRLADDPARHLTNERHAAREDPEIRSTEAHRDPERLPLPHRDVGAERAGRLQQGVRVRLRHLDAERARCVCGIRDRPHVDETAERVGVLHDEAGRALGRRREIPRRDFHDLEVRSLRVCPNRAAEFEIDLACHHDLLAARRANRHEGGLSDRRPTLVHR